MLHGYCIRRADDPPPPVGILGVDDAPVAHIRVDRLGLWISEIAIAPPSIERLKAHDRVIREAMRTRTVLPFRFGTTFKDEPAAYETISERAPDLEAAFERIGQRVEMGMRVAWREISRASEVNTASDAAAPGTPESLRSEVVEDGAVGAGRAFLEERRRARWKEARNRERADRLLIELDEQLADLEAPSVHTVLARGELAGTLAHLLQRTEAAAYRRRAEDLQSRHPEVHITVTGPWAPYSFV